MLSWVANVLICFGAWHVAKKRWWAFLFSLAGEAVWIIYAAEQRLWSLAFICIVFSLLAVRNMLAWRTSEV